MPHRQMTTLCFTCIQPLPCIVTMFWAGCSCSNHRHYSMTWAVYSILYISKGTLRTEPLKWVSVHKNVPTEIKLAQSSWNKKWYSLYIYLLHSETIVNDITIINCLLGKSEVRKSSILKHIEKTMVPYYSIVSYNI